MGALKKPIRLTLRKKLVFAATATILFFLLLEALLAGIGFRPQANQTDRTVGFSSYAPLFVETTDGQGRAVLATAQNKLHWFNYQTFPKEKAAGTQRIFCMGGSTTYGHPYWDETSFAGWLRRTLPILDDSQEWQVINAGGISYASYRVAALMEELSQYEPDLFIVYSAHNEFLERRTYANMFAQPALTRDLTALLAHTRIWTVAERAVLAVRGQSPPQSSSSTLASSPQLAAEVDEELNHTIGPVDYHRDDAWRDAVVADYRANVQRMIDIAQRCGAKILFVAPAANEKDCAPFKSEMTHLNPADQATMQALILNGDQALDQSQFAAAAQSFAQAVKMDERYADAHFRLGRALLAQAQAGQALTEFSRAVDEDVCPLRAITPIKEALRAVTKRNAVPLVDFEARLRELSQTQTGTSILGNEVFLDHVHPTIEVNRLLSTWIIEALQDADWIKRVSLKDNSIQTQLEQMRQRTLTAIDRDDEIFALRNLAKVIHWSGKFQEAISLARDVLDLAPGDPESRHIIASCLANLGRTQEALEEYDLLFADGIGFPRAYLSYGELLAANGRLEQAKAYLLLAVLRNPDSPDAYESLGKVHAELGEEAFAREAFDTAAKLRQSPGK